VQPSSTNCPACGGPNDLGNPSCTWCGATLVVPPGVQRRPMPPPPQARMPAPPPPMPRPAPPPYVQPQAKSGCPRALAGCLIVCGVIFALFVILGIIGAMMSPTTKPTPAPVHHQTARPHPRG
jgi:hypothetical protein